MNLFDKTTPQSMLADDPPEPLLQILIQNKFIQISLTISNNINIVLTNRLFFKLLSGQNIATCILKISMMRRHL